MKFLSAIAIQLLSSPAIAQSSFTAEHARRLYETLKAPVTHYVAADESYSHFVKDEEWVKCSAATDGDESEPGLDAAYSCEFKSIP